MRLDLCRNKAGSIDQFLPDRTTKVDLSHTKKIELSLHLNSLSWTGMDIQYDLDDNEK